MIQQLKEHDSNPVTTVERRIDLYCLMVGLGESLTGLLLLVAPLWTLQLMAVQDLPTEPIYLRFIGAFVAGVGSAYWLPRLLPSAGLRRRRRTVLEVTAWERLVVGLFVLVAVSTGALSLPWWSVCLTDLGLAAFQLWLLRRLLTRRVRESGDDD